MEWKSYMEWDMRVCSKGIPLQYEHQWESFEMHTGVPPPQLSAQVHRFEAGTLALAVHAHLVCGCQSREAINDELWDHALDGRVDGARHAAMLRVIGANSEGRDARLV